MPLVLHGDLIFIQYFPWHWSYRGVQDIYGHFADTFLKQGFTYYHPMVFWITGLWQMITRPLAAGFDSWMQRADGLMGAASPRGILDYLDGFAQIDVIRWLFLAKLLYLIADLLCWPLVRAIARRDPGLRGLERAWLFHPVLLFSIFAFGQYRILPALAVWASAALLQRDRKTLAALAFGCVLLLDNFGLLILLPTVLTWADGWRERARLLATMLAPAVAVLAPWALISKGYVLACYFSPVVQRASMQGIFRGLTPESALAFKALFACLWVWVVAACWRGGARTPAERLILWASASSAVLLALYATSTTMIHYFMWVLAFWILVRVSGILRPGWLAAATVGLLFLFNLDSREMNLALMVHLDPALAEAPSLHELMDRYMPWGKCVALARLTFSVICLFWVFQIVKSILAFKSREKSHA